MDQWGTNRQRSVKKKKTIKLKSLIELLYKFFLIVLTLVFLQSIVKNIIISVQLAVQRNKVEAMVEEKASLDQQIEQSKTDFFVEKIAREKLDMLKSGEIILKLQSDK